jgi:hypothetical protein
MTDESVVGDGGGAGAGDGDEPAAFEDKDGSLYGGLGESCGFDELLQADRDASVSGAIELCPENDIDEKCRGGAVVTGEIGEQDVEHVVVDGCMVHTTIVFIVINRCQQRFDVRTMSLEIRRKR